MVTNVRRLVGDDGGGEATNHLGDSGISYFIHSSRLEVDLGFSWYSYEG